MRDVAEPSAAAFTPVTLSISLNVIGTSLLRWSAQKFAKRLYFPMM